MKTLGIDLAAQDKKTASCAIEWISERVLVELPVVGGSPSDLLTAMQKADWIGIDAPFGWPDTMVEAIYRYAHEGTWPGSAVPEKLRYRTTDWFVHDLIADERDVSVWPLSVSSDRIAVCAWRCANLLTEYAARTGWKLDRIGVPLSAGMDGPPETTRPTGIVAERGVVEVYPAAALALWGFAFKGYKRNSGTPANVARDKRISILADLERAAGAWLILSDDVREACIDNDDAFDAFISSLVACAAATDNTLRPLVEQRGTAQREGWIHLPSPGSIESLAPAAV
jgi:predicted nuclease with RNAse H fold